MFVTVNPFHPSLFVGKAGAFQSRATFGTPLPKIIDWESVPNTLAYIDTKFITTGKCFVTKGLGQLWMTPF